MGYFEQIGDHIVVGFEKVHEEAMVPTYAHSGDSGMDLVTVEDVYIRPGETVLIRTGLKMIMPKGYEAQIRPRSGIASKTRLRVVNTPGTIDSNYRGEVMVAMENTSIDIAFIAKELNLNNPHENEVAMAYPVDKNDPGFVKNARGMYHIPAGTRIAQLVIMQVTTVWVDEVESVEALDEFHNTRGTGGFGSTGVEA